MLKLHEYQKKAVEFCLRNKTVFLAMDLGLGKTVVSMTVKKIIKQPAIVFGNLDAIYDTWPKEIEKWYPEFTYSILHGPNKSNVLHHSDADFLLINYDGLKWFNNEMTSGKVRWKRRMLILDESSLIKSPTTLRFKTLRKMMPLWSDYRLDLSATPAPKGYHNLWSQYYMLDKGERLFSSYYRFRGRYFNYTGPPLYKTTLRKGGFEAIRDKVKDITYRLEGDDHLDLPRFIYNDIVLKLPPQLRSQYKELEDNFFLEFEEAGATAFSAAGLSMKLRQFIQGAVYTDQKDGSFYPLHQIKVNALKNLLESSAGQPILCPIQFKFELKMIKEFIDSNVPCIVGGTKPSERKYYINAWNEGDLPLLLCHPRSLSKSVNLQAGGHILLWFALTWSLEDYQQLNGRLRRQGQESNHVVVNHLVMEDTVDQRVAKVLASDDATQRKLLDALKR